MKIAVALVFLCFIGSCSVSNYYQVFKVASLGGILEKKTLMFEDYHCIIRYNIWNDGGLVKFNIFNKGSEDIIVNLESSFFVLHGKAFSYFQNRIFTKSTNQGLTRTSNFYPDYLIFPVTRVSGSHFVGYSTYPLFG